jgi:hypothetical protein
MDCEQLPDPLLLDELCQPWQHQARTALKRGDLNRFADIVLSNSSQTAASYRRNAFLIAKHIGEAHHTLHQTELLYAIALQRLSEIISGERSETELDDVAFLAQASMTPDSQISAQALLLVTRQCPRLPVRSLLAYLQRLAEVDADMHRLSMEHARTVLLGMIDLPR